MRICRIGCRLSLGAGVSESVGQSRRVNPYAPPQAATWAEWPLLPPERFAEVQVRVDRVVPGTMERRIWITGTTLAEIHYFQAAMDTVTVNGQLRGRGSLWDTAIVSPTIEFWLDGEGLSHSGPGRCRRRILVADGVPADEVQTDRRGQGDLRRRAMVGDALKPASCNNCAAREPGRGGNRLHRIGVWQGVAPAGESPSRDSPTTQPQGARGA